MELARFAHWRRWQVPLRRAAVFQSAIACWLPSTDNRSIILAPLLKRQAPSAPLGYPFAHIVCCTARVRCWHKADIRCGAMQCPLLGVKRTLCERTPVSAFDPKLTWAAQDCCYAN